ncbi:non-ribosomal peptide synthetase/type I polyketide synthase [Actinoalloteichus caeruleus]|uniref:non-ribosomal peptide synthetase/type I polyketide synthase n=3 Tax=Actinoalloteichus cyanogriseus TaxID=2893586 RepID=UPI0004C296B0|nr:non-ribosomal peptide synthetase/type I polyketide synthase [Actinoalloteichus caeruleus]
MTDLGNAPTGDRIAIIGIGCRLPGGASDYRTFWQNLLAGKDCITDTPADRYDVRTLGSRDKAKPGRLVGGRGGYIDGFDEFDPAFFGISPREAEHMDPQQRKLLEVSWEALEDGGQRPGELAGRDIGVFVGAFTLDYKILQFADLSFETLAAHTATGTMMTMVSNRISYCFDFRGPSVSIDTACSSSLVAVHLACQSLRRGETELALAGGTLLHLTPQYTIAETKGGFLSPDGRSRTFDASANGYVRAEGVGVVALKLLDEAIRDGDPIHAVITASGVNQDGRTNGITVPNPDAQVSLIERVCADAGIQPGDLQYMEAHGTSTPVGDPIEANALGRALAVGRAPGTRCYVGSVKTNIGHTESAAGIAGLIKTVLCLENRTIPPHINLDQVNPAIDLDSLPYEIPTSVTDWPEHEGPARAGVNSFGFGGTNAHVLLEEAPVRASGVERSTPGEFGILPLTARDPEALPELAGNIRAELAREHEPVSLADLGHTLARRRQHLEHRLSVVYSSRESLQDRLAEFARGEAHPHLLVDQCRDAGDRRLAWVFTGMGPQWWAMGRQLFESEPVYREAVERCDAALRLFADWSLIEEMNASESDSQMAETWLAQPANFAVQVGLAALWRSRGVHPDAIVGHSTGEIAAFHEAGVYTLEDAARVAVHRSRLQQKLVGTGTMLAVSLAEEEAARRVAPYGDRVSIAAVNSPTGMTLAGDQDALAELAGALRDEQIFAKFLTVRVPYHSARMDPIKEDLLSSLSELDPRPAQLPLYLTGEEGRAHGTELDGGYWWKNVRDSVRFRAAVDRMAADGYSVFLEVGPHPVLAHSIRECLGEHGVDGRTIPSIRRQEGEVERFTQSLAALHNLGVAIDWATIHPTGSTVALPRYPWRRDRYWVEPEPVRQIRLGEVDHPLLGRRTGNAEPTWEARLDVETMPYLDDHRIQGNALFPAAGYVEMAHQAVRALTGGARATVADVELRKALFLPDSEVRTVQFSLSSSGAEFRIATVADAGAEPTVHATGVVRAGQRRRLSSTLDVDLVRDRASRHLDATACYTGLAEAGYHYGPAFQGIEEVWIGSGEALARIRPTRDLGADAEDHHLHPVLLDSCFQTLLTPFVLGAEAERLDTGIRLPLSIGEVRVDPVGDRALWAHARLGVGDGDELIGDIDLYTEDGTPLGRVSDFRAADVEKASTAVSVSTIDGWLATPTWVEAPWEHDRTADTPAAPGNWLILADRGGLGEALAALVTGRGGRAHLVRPGPGYTLGAERPESTVAPGSRTDLRALLADTAADGGFDTVVHLWNLDLPHLADTGREDLAEHTSLGAYTLLALAQALTDEGASARLHVVTRGTQAVRADEAVEPLGAPSWGVARVLWYQELVDNRGKLVDLDPGAQHTGPDLHAEAEALLRELAVDDEHEVALRGDQRHTNRLRPPENLTRPLPPRLRADGSYLVTGAFGALGRLLCRTLVHRGARRLVLVARRTLPDRSRWSELDPSTREAETVRFVRELEALGAQPVIAPVDVTDEDALSSWLVEHRRSGAPPIRGVFHLAGHVRDTLLPEMDRDTFDAVHDPKVVGGYLLHKHLLDDPVEHFVLFASIASLLTTAGQSNYAAGNAFLDALAHHRRAQGLPALSVDWGPWATGMIEELGLIEHYRVSRGMSSLAPEAGMAVLERVLGLDQAQLLVATVVDWPVFLAWYTTPPPLVADLAASGGAGATAGTSSFLDEFRAADEELRRDLLGARFTEITSSVLRVRSDQVEPDSSLNTLGLDSLLAMELRTRLHTELGVALPVVALLSSSPIEELLDGLHTQVRDLVAEDGDQGPDATVIEVYQDEGEYPLTQNQKALWFLKQLHPDGFAYNIGGAVEVRTELEPELMFEAVRALIDRHPSLRTNFLLRDGQAVQRVSPRAEADVALFDVADTAWPEIYQMIIDEYRRPYDLERDPLVRFRLFRRGPDRWLIMKAVHHIISDAISTFTFIEELLATYETMRATGRSTADPELLAAAGLAPVGARYLDFLNWQNRFLASADARRMREYWLNHLPAEVPILNLPTDKPRPPVQTHNGASEFFTLDEDLTARVHALAREHNVTVFVVLIAAYYLLLQRHSGQDEVIVGSPVTGRTEQQFSSVYGYFVNPLPLHVDLGGEPSVTELLDRVRGTVLNGLDNQEYPFVLLVDELGLQHDPSRSAVFQAMFILLVHRVATEKYGYRLDYIDLPEEEGQFDLTLSAYEDEAEHRFHCVFKYNTDLFLPRTMRRLAEHYVNLLTGLTSAAPAEPVDRLPLLGNEERAEILDGWSGANRIEAAARRPVHDLIAEAAARTPDAVAVSLPVEDGPSQQLRYGELMRRADEIAGHLRARGARPGAVVALCQEKSPELICTVLAVLRTGAAYLPLDPGYPAERLDYMVSTASAALVVADPPVRDRLTALPCAVVTLDELAADPDPGFVPAPVDLDSPAYVIYTSGSTGRPKAVRVSHRNLASVQEAWRTEYRLDDEVRVHLQMASFSFDVFTGDLVRALCSGGTLVLVDRDLLFDTARLHRTILAERVDCGEFVPAVVRTLATYCENEGERLDSLRLLVVGSDAWKVEEYQRLRNLCGPSTRLVNSYGLSETTIDSAYFEGSVDHLEPGQMVPIGRPLPGSELYILDERGEPTPTGVPGELWIGGEGVSDGYVGDPEQTDARFVTRVLGTAPDAPALRLYRTGDLARWDTAGGVELLGRVDNQVKVHGHRIETGEIESRLTSWDGLSEAVVTVRADGRGENVLCAYCVAVPDVGFDRRELRRHLAEYLPTFMIPTHLVELDALPLTPNGKVDIAALPAPDGADDEQPYEPPTTLYEVRMAAHWEALLGVERVGLHHDFFELGGGSIKLIELIYHLQNEFAVSIPVSQLFRVTTLHGMASAVQDIVTGRTEGALPYLRFNPDRDDTVFCFPPAGGHGLVYRQFAAQLDEYRLVAFNYLTGDDKVGRYADLVESLREEGQLLLLGYSLGGNLAYEVARELEARGRVVREVVILDSHRLTETFELAEEHLAVFQEELSDHLRRHTGSDIVSKETMSQARDYLEFSSRTPNTGTIVAPITLVSDQDRVDSYAATAPGSWYGGSRTRTTVLRGSGTHAEMLDQEHAEANADLLRVLLAGGVVDAA